MNNNPPEKYDKNPGEEVRLLYESLLIDIQFYKSQQWSTTNYVIGIYITLVGISQIFKTNHYSIINICLVLLGFLTMLGGLYLLFQFELDLNLSKSIKDEIIENFSKEFNSYINRLKNKETGSILISKMLNFLIIFGAIVVYVIINS